MKKMRKANNAKHTLYTERSYPFIESQKFFMLGPPHYGSRIPQFWNHINKCRIKLILLKVKYGYCHAVHEKMQSRYCDVSWGKNGQLLQKINKRLSFYIDFINIKINYVLQEYVTKFTQRRNLKNVLQFLQSDRRRRQQKYTGFFESFFKILKITKVSSSEDAN